MGIDCIQGELSLLMSCRRSCQHIGTCVLPNEANSNQPLRPQASNTLGVHTSASAFERPVAALATRRRRHHASCTHIRPDSPNQAASSPNQAASSRNLAAATRQTNVTGCAGAADLAASTELGHRRLIGEERARSREIPKRKIVCVCGGAAVAGSFMLHTQ